MKTSALPYPNDDIERRLRAGCRVERRLRVKSPAEFIELQQRLIKEGVETAVGDSRRIAQLTTAVFTAAFEPVKKRIEAVQNAAHP